MKSNSVGVHNPVTDSPDDHPDIPEEGFRSLPKSRSWAQQPAFDVLPQKTSIRNVRQFHFPNPNRSTQPGDPSANFNGQIPLNLNEPGGELASCRHFATTFIEKTGIARKPLPKTVFSVDSILSGATTFSEAAYVKYRSKAHKDIIATGELGEWIAFQMTRLRNAKANASGINADADGRRWCSAMLETGDHSMAMTIEIKPVNNEMEELDGQGGPDELRYVVRFFDPNMTHTYTRMATSSLDEVKKTGFLDVLAGNECHRKLYDRCTPGVIALLTEQSQEVATFGARRPVPSDPETAGHRLWYAMDLNVPEEIEQLACEAGHMSAQAFGKLMNPESQNGPALFMALQDDHGEAIAAYSKLVIAKDIDPVAFKELLAAKREDGTPGLFIALQKGQAKAIRAYANLTRIKDILPADLKEVLLAMRADGSPGLFIALQTDQADAITAYAKLFDGKDFSPPQLQELLLAKDARKIPALFMALQNGNSKAISAYAGLVNATRIDEDGLRELLLAKNARGVPGVVIALANGHHKAIQALHRLLESASATPEVRQAVLRELDRAGGADSRFIQSNPDFYKWARTRQPLAYRAFEEFKAALK